MTTQTADDTPARSRSCLRWRYSGQPQLQPPWRRSSPQLNQFPTPTTFPQPLTTLQPSAEPVSYANYVPVDRWSSYCLPSHPLAARPLFQSWDDPGQLVDSHDCRSIPEKFLTCLSIRPLFSPTIRAWQRPTPLRLHGRYPPTRLSPRQRQHTPVNQGLNKPGHRSSCLFNRCVHISNHLKLPLRPDCLVLDHQCLDRDQAYRLQPRTSASSTNSSYIYDRADPIFNTAWDTATATLPYTNISCAIRPIKACYLNFMLPSVSFFFSPLSIIFIYKLYAGPTSSHVTRSRNKCLLAVTQLAECAFFLQAHFSHF